jgi:hypothetical protein
LDLIESPIEQLDGNGNSSLAYEYDLSEKEQNDAQFGNYFQKAEFNTHIELKLDVDVQSTQSPVGFVQSPYTGYDLFELQNHAGRENALHIFEFWEGSATYLSNWNSNDQWGGFMLYLENYINRYKEFRIEFLDQNGEQIFNIGFQYYWSQACTLFIERSNVRIDCDPCSIRLWNTITYHYVSGEGLSVFLNGLEQSFYPFENQGQGINSIRLYFGQSSWGGSSEPIDLYIDDFWTSDCMDYIHYPATSNIAIFFEHGWIDYLGIDFSLYFITRAITFTSMKIFPTPEGITAIFDIQFEITDFNTYRSNFDLILISYSLNSGIWTRLTGLPTTKIKLSLVNFDMKINTYYGTPDVTDINRGSLSKDISVGLQGFNIADLDKITQIIVQMKGNIVENVWNDNSPYQNIFTLDEVLQWESRNSMESFIQIYNFGTQSYENLRAAFNPANQELCKYYGLNESDARFQIQYLFGFTSSRSNYFPGFPFILSLNLNTDAYLNSQFGPESSNYIDISLQTISITLVYLPTLKKNPYVSHEVDLEFEIDVDDLSKEDALTLDVGFYINTYASTVLGTRLSMDIAQFRWTSPLAKIQFYSIMEQRWIDLQTIPLQAKTNTTYYHLQGHCMLSFYSRSELTGYIQTDPQTNRQKIMGTIRVQYALQNHLIFPIQLTSNYNSIEIEADAITFSREIVQFSQSVYQSLSIFDVDGDKDFDVLPDDGSAILFASNYATFPMRINATTNGQLVSEYYFLATVDISRPHPEFFGFESFVGDKGVPEMKNGSFLHIVDYSFDLVKADLFYSYDNVEFELHMTQTVTDECYFTYEIDTSFFAPGLIYFKAVHWDNAGSGETVMAVWIDSCAPRTEVTLPYRDTITNITSIRTPFEFELIDDASIRYLNFGFTLTSGEVLYQTRISHPTSILSYILLDFLHGLSLQERELFAYCFAEDMAGNLENVQWFSIELDDNYTPILSSDYTGGNELGFVDTQFETTITGQMIDSFGMPAPANLLVELQLNGLRYAYAMTDTEGRFTCSVLSTDLYSEDLRMQPDLRVNYRGTSPTGFKNGLPISVPYHQGITLVHNVDAVQRFFIHTDDSPLMMYYSGFNFQNLSNSHSFESWRFEIIIPSIMNDYVGTVFNKLMFAFADDQNNSWSYSLNSQQIKVLAEESNEVSWSMMKMRFLSIDIPLAVLKNDQNDIPIGNITSIYIIGFENDVHPGFSMIDPTTMFITLGICGIYLIDQLNNATIYYKDDPTGESSDYTPTILFRSFALAGIAVICQEKLRIRRRQFTLEALSPSPYLIKCDYSDTVIFSNIILRSEVMEDYTAVKTSMSTFDYIQIIGFNDHTKQWVIMGWPAGFGINNKMEFLINATPGIYSDVSLYYSGNPLLEPYLLKVCELFQISKESVLLELAEPDIQGTYYKHIPRNAITPLVGQLTDEESRMLLDYWNTTAQFITLPNGTLWELPGHCVALVKMLDNGGFLPLAIAEIWGGGYFNFSLDTRVGGNLYLEPGMHMCQLMFLGTTNYKPLDVYFALIIDPSPIRLEFVPNTEFDSIDRGIYRENGDYLELDLGLTMTDEKSLRFQLFDTATEEPVEGVPLWLQVGITPNINNPTLASNKLADADGMYTVSQVGGDLSRVSSDFAYRYWKQEKTTRPIAYPFFNGTTQRWEMWGPRYYMPALTDTSGIARFDLPPELLRGILEDYSLLLKDSSIYSVDDCDLYIRVFYANAFGSDFMRLKYEIPTVYDGFVTVYYATPDLVYTVDDAIYAPDSAYYHADSCYFMDPYRYGGFGEGRIHISKEDTMLVAYYQEVLGMQPFSVSVATIECDIINGIRTPENQTARSNYIETYGLPGNDFSIDFQIYNQLNLTKVITGRYLHNTDEYVSYIQKTDQTGVADYYCGEESFGIQFNRLVPDVYTLRYNGVSLSPYYNTPSPTSAMLVIKSEYTYNLDLPSTLYSLGSLITHDPQTSVLFSSTSGTVNEGIYDINYPTLVFDVEFATLESLPLEYNQTDLYQLDVMLNGQTVKSIACSDPRSQIPVFNKETETYNWIPNPDSPLKHIEIPLKYYVGVFNLSYTIRYMPRPDYNIDWDAMYDSWNATLMENYGYFKGLYSQDLNLWESWENRYYSAKESELLAILWESYEMVFLCEIILSNIQLLESKTRSDGQVWDILAEMPSIGPDDAKNDLSVFCNYQPAQGWVTVDNTLYDGFQFEVIYNGPQTDQEFSKNLIAFSGNFESLHWVFDDGGFAPNFTNHTEINNSIIFQELAYIEPWSWKIQQPLEFSYLAQYDIVEGYQLGDSWEHSIRGSGYTRHHDAAEPDFNDDAVYVGLDSGESVEIIRSELRVPWGAKFDGLLLVPNFGSNLFPTRPMVNVSLTLTPTLGGQPWTVSWISSSFYDSTYGGNLVDLSVHLPESYIGSFVNLSFKISLLNAAHLTQLFILRGYLTGEENIIKISNMFPSGLRARQFSALYQYWYTAYAKQWAIPATDTPDEIGQEDYTINDVFYTLSDAPSLGINPLTEILHMWDIRRMMEQMIAHGLEYWDYDEDDLDYFFHDDTNTATYAEYAPDDAQGVHMVKTRFDEEKIGALTSPKAYSGFISLYDVTPGGISSEPLKKRKITIMVMPSIWHQNYETGLIPKFTAAGITGESNINVNINPEEDNDYKGFFTYQMDPGPHDFVIANWAATYVRPDAPPSPTTHSPAIDQLFYDDKYVSRYLDPLFFEDYSEIYFGNYHLYYKEIGATTYLGANYTVGAGSKVTIPFYPFKAQYEGKGLHLIDFPVQLTNATGLISITVEAQFGVGYLPSATLTLQKTNLTSFSVVDFIFDSREIADPLQAMTIQFEVNTSIWANGVQIPLFFPGIGMYSDYSIGNLAIRGTSDKIFSQERLFPTPFTSALSPRYFTFDLTCNEAVNGPVASIQASASSFSSITAYNFGIIKSPKSKPQDSVSVYYYSFNSGDRDLQQIQAGLFNQPVACAWVGVTRNIVPWMQIQNLDINGDAVYDLTIQYFDGEGVGNFTNGIADCITYFDGNGEMLFQVSTGVDISYQVVTRNTLYNGAAIYDDNDADYFIGGHHYVCRVEQAYTEIREGGTSVRKYTTAVSEPVPEYRQYQVIDGVYFPYLGWKMGRPVEGMLIMQDSNGDGAIDTWDNYQDLWSQDNALPDQYDTFAGYETYTSVHKLSLPVFDPDQLAASVASPDIIGYTTKTLETSGNDLAVDATFRLASPDGLVTLSGSVIPVYDTPVVFDSRPYLRNYLRLDSHGVVYWYNTNPGEDNTYELGFIFTNASYAHNTAVAVYINRQGDGQIRTTPASLNQAGDMIVPLWWLANAGDFADWGFTGEEQSKASVFDYIRGAAAAEVQAGFSEQRNSDEFWLLMACDFSATVAIQLGVAAAVPTGGLSFAATILFYTAYQYLLRPGLAYTIESFSQDQAKELRKGGNQDSGFNLENFLNELVEGGQQLFRDLGIGDDPVKYYDQRVEFLDTTPFYTDLTDGGYLLAAPNEDIARYITVHMPVVYTDDIFYSQQANFNKFIGFLIASPEDQITYLTDHYPEALEMVPGAIRNLFGAQTVDKAEAAFKEWTAQDIYNRRAAHEIFYRRPQQPSPYVVRPPGPVRITDRTRQRLMLTSAGRFTLALNSVGSLFNHEDIPVSAYRPALELGEFALAPSRAQSNLAYVTNPRNGIPALVAASGPGLNFSDPLAYEVDYGLMCLVSLYQSEMQWASENDPAIQSFQFLMTVLQTAVSVTAGWAGRGALLGAGLTAGAAVQGLAGEAFQELFWEQVFSTLATWVGVCPFIAEFVLGEVLGDALSVSGLLGGIHALFKGAFDSARGTVTAASQALAKPLAGVKEAAATVEAIVASEHGDALGALIDLAHQAGCQARAANVNTPGLAPKVIAATVARIEALIADTAANSRAVRQAYASFLQGASFVNYPGTLLSGRQMAGLLFAAAAAHPGLPVTDVLALPAVQALFGVGGTTGRCHYLQVAVKGEGVYTFDDAGGATRTNADGTIQTLASSPTLLEIALYPNAGPLQFVDPPVTSKDTSSDVERNAIAQKCVIFLSTLGLSNVNNIQTLLLSQFAHQIIKSKEGTENTIEMEITGVKYQLIFTRDQLNHEYGDPNNPNRKQHSVDFVPSLAGQNWNNKNGEIFANALLSFLSDSNIEIQDGYYKDFHGVHFYKKVNPMQALWIFCIDAPNGQFKYLTSFLLSVEQTRYLETPPHQVR